MGGLFFCVLTDPTKINLSLTNSFMKLQSRGQGYTQYIIDHTKDLDLLGNRIFKNRLSKSDSLTYKKNYFIYGFHRSIINDDSLNGIQPFQDPIPHMIFTFPELKQRPLRKLLCNGEIYNYQSLVSENSFTNKDLSSSSDIEIILPLFIKYGLSETLSKLKGEYAFILTENTDTYILSEIKIYAARDPLGIKPLYYIINNDIKFFFSEKSCIPDYLKTCIVHEFPIGSYWSYHTSTFVKFHDFNSYNQNDIVYSIATASSDNLELVYNTIPSLLESSIRDRLHNSLGIFISDGFDSSILLSILCKIGLTSINIFSFGSLIGDNCIKYLKQSYPNVTFNHYSVSEDLNLSSETITAIQAKLENDSQLPKAIGIYSLMNIVKKTGIKVILCGEGLSSMFPNTTLDDFQATSIERLNNLHLNSLLIWDRIGGMFDVESRFPWLDLALIDFIMKISPHLRTPQIHNESRISKYLVRKSFDNSQYLPNDIIWNTSDPFSPEYNTY